MSCKLVSLLLYHHCKQFPNKDKLYLHVSSIYLHLKVKMSESGVTLLDFVKHYPKLVWRNGPICVSIALPVKIGLVDCLYSCLYLSLIGST